MKKTTGLIMALIMAISLFSFQNYSAQAASIEAHANPEALTGAGYVTVTITLKNDSKNPMEQIYITGNDSSYDGSDDVIEPGKTLNCVISNVHIALEQLGTPIPFLVSWMEKDAPKTKTINVTVKKTGVVKPSDPPSQSPAPTAPPQESVLTVKRTASKNVAELSEKITLTYVVLNTGNNSISGVSLTDPDIRKNGAIFSNVTIKAGDSYTNEYVFTMGDKDATSKPVVKYELNGVTLSATTDSLIIKRTLTQIDLSVNQSETTVNGTDFTITATNNGNNSITGVSITDDAGVAVSEKFDLAIGGSKALTYHVAPDVTRNIFFTITGTMDSGVPYSSKTKEYPVYAYVDPNLLGLTLAVEVAVPLNHDGYVSLKFTVKNEGSVAMSALELKEERGGIICKFKNLASGESDSGVYSIYVGEARDLNFVLSSKDAVGKACEYKTLISAATIIGGEILSPSATAVAPGGNVGSTISDALVTILIVLGILTGLAGVALIVLSVFEFKEKQRLETMKRAQHKKRLQDNKDQNK
ncbi:MAG: hypothetical protein RRY79_05680 [Clostridia bacterium]